jgi:hypothetical protein
MPIRSNAIELAKLAMNKKVAGSAMAGMEEKISQSFCCHIAKSGIMVAKNSEPAKRYKFSMLAGGNEKNCSTWERNRSCRFRPWIAF